MLAKLRMPLAGLVYVMVFLEFSYKQQAVVDDEPVLLEILDTASQVTAVPSYLLANSVIERSIQVQN